MKKILSIFFATLVLCSIFAISAHAEGLENVTIEYLDNGDYIITYFDDENIYPDDGSKTTVTKTKTSKYKNSAGETMWYIKVQGTFTYNGGSCTCTKAAHQAGAPGSTWSIVSASHSKSGNHATATATARHTSPTGYNDYTRSVTLTCSPTGVFS